ncbi:MAG: hypothetical protein HN348_35895, partial [Proteobacteria bacterium]|nr:hypothetical protein [Pseudomonadota bacterium]
MEWSLPVSGELFQDRWLIDATEPHRRGGNGVVFRATDTFGEFDGHLAVKVLENYSRYRRFRREVRLIGECDHPNIVGVLCSRLPEPHSDDSLAFFVMKWMVGGSLAHRFNEGTAVETPSQAVALLLPIVD